MFTQLSLGQPKSRQDRVRGDAPEPEGRARAEQAEGEQAGSQLVRWGQEVEAGLRTGEEGEQVREERVKAQGRHIEELVVENERIASEVERTLGENRAAEGSLAATREEAGHWTVLANCIVLIFHLVLLKTHNHSHSLGRESIERKGVYYTRNLAPYHTDRRTRCPTRLCGPGEGGAGCQLAVDSSVAGPQGGVHGAPVPDDRPVQVPPGAEQEPGGRSDVVRESQGSRSRSLLPGWESGFSSLEGNLTTSLDLLEYIISLRLSSGPVQIYI
jgi:hypothetical protein